MPLGCGREVEVVHAGRGRGDDPQQLGPLEDLAVRPDVQLGEVGVKLGNPVVQHLLHRRQRNHIGDARQGFEDLGISGEVGQIKDFPAHGLHFPGRPEAGGAANSTKARQAMSWTEGSSPIDLLSS